MSSLTYWLICGVFGLPHLLLFLSYIRVLHYKRSQIARLLVDETRERYREAHGLVSYEEFFKLRYNFLSFGIAIAFTMVVILFTAAAVLAATGVVPGVPRSFATLTQSLPTAIWTAAAGGYLWGLYELMRRHQRADLTPVSVNFLWLRLLMAVALGYVVSRTTVAPLDVLVAFAVASTPLAAILKWLRAVGQKRKGIDVSDGPSEAPNLHNLQGTAPDVVARLEEEGISRVQQLAMGDPMNLFLATNIEWRLILDLIDQAILYNYVMEKIPLLRPLAIRGAIEVKGLAEELESNEQAEQTHAHDMIPAISQALGIPPVGVNNLLVTVQWDAQVRLIDRLWTLVFAR